MWPFYKSVKSRNLSNVLSVLCHVGPTLSSLVARNALVIYVEVSFRIKKIYVTRRFSIPISFVFIYNKK